MGTDLTNVHSERETVLFSVHKEEDLVVDHRGGPKGERGGEYSQKFDDIDVLLSTPSFSDLVRWRIHGMSYVQDFPHESGGSSRPDVDIFCL